MSNYVATSQSPSPQPRALRQKSISLTRNGWRYQSSRRDHLSPRRGGGGGGALAPQWRGLRGLGGRLVLLLLFLVVLLLNPYMSV